MGMKELEQAIVQQRVISVDTMIFIYFLDRNPRYFEMSELILKSIESGTVQGVISILAIAELLTTPAKANDTQTAHQLEMYLRNFPNLQIKDVDINVARTAAQIRANSGLKMPDAIQIATAIVAGADAIIGNDKQWRNKFMQPQLLLLDSFLES